MQVQVVVHSKKIAYITVLIPLRKLQMVARANLGQKHGNSQEYLTFRISIE
ncbi:hypothetical protein BFV94_4952 [Alteromonas macleodii]|jgi:hypothetical protein|nr:hypothetical protein BFV93_4980 [Alteromonas macleodii]OES24002.1 hypothetical protein BFV94_4952 [Alteromonas macleodii]OES38886.1 hypothetical protein BFV96_4484 [Alteromonas macleodii]|tara:strand:+ start:1340 stop:1492 length:153 start_codon:yes stop_codon:yes gene_type:complete